MKARLFILTALLLLSYQSYAATEICRQLYENTIENSSRDAAWVFSVLYQQMDLQGCVGTEYDSGSFFSKLVQAQRSDKDPAVLRSNLFDQVEQTLKAINGQDCNDNNIVDCMLQKQLASVLTLKGELTSQSIPNPELLDHDFWIVKNRGKLDSAGGNLNQILTPACATLNSPECREGFNSSAVLMQAGIAMNEIVTAHRIPVIEANAEFLSLRDKEWEEYFNELSVQYPWELAWNSRRYTNSLTQEQLAGFPRAPTSKLIFLHPSVGIEHIDTPTSKSSQEAVVLLEIIGYEKWKWRNGKAKQRWGGSFALSLADIEGMDEVGWGFIVRTPFRNISLGLIHRDGDNGSETGFFINVSLAKLTQEYKNINVRKFLKIN